MKKRNELFIRKLLSGVAVTTVFTMNVGTICAESTTEMTRVIKNYKEASREELEWDNMDKAPTIKVTIKDGYKLKGKKEEFEIELVGAKWFEEEDTTLSFSNTEGIEMYEGYISTDSKTVARVNIDIPGDIEEEEDIVLEIPLLIKVNKNAEEVSARISDKDSENGLVQDAYVPLAISTDKQMNWSVGSIPTISDGGTIAPITFTETQAGILGSRELEIYLQINNRYIQFKEPEYLSKDVYSDNIEYELDVDKYLEYKGGFEKKGQTLKIAINKNGQNMRIRMNGSVPSEIGIIELYNLPIESTTKDALDEDVSVTVQGEKILNNNGKVIMAHFKTADKEEEIKEELEQDLVVEKNEETEQEVVKEEKKTNIQFKVGEERYLLNGEVHEMQGKSYVKAPGYTMVPVRYVAEALGGTDIQCANSIVSFNYNGEKVTLTIGSTAATIGEQAKQLEVPLELVNGRVYAPIGSIANLLSVQKMWDNKTQTATFTK